MKNSGQYKSNLYHHIRILQMPGSRKGKRKYCLYFRSNITEQGYYFRSGKLLGDMIYIGRADIFDSRVEALRTAKRLFTGFKLEGK